MKTTRKSINLFEDKNIRCYKTVFNITDEEDLLQWWEYNIENSVEKYKAGTVAINADGNTYINKIEAIPFKLLRG